MLVKVENGQVVQYPYTQDMAELEYQGMVFGSSFAFEGIPELGIHPVVDTPPPKYPITQILVEGTPRLENNTYYRTWILNEAPEEEVTVRLNAVSKMVRDFRDQLLAQSDWTQLPDATVDKEAWAAYRQELRDISKLEGFPLNLTFPEKPR